MPTYSFLACQKEIEELKEQNKRYREALEKISAPIDKVTYAYMFAVKQIARQVKHWSVKQVIKCLKRLFCKHRQYEHIRTIHGEEIRYSGWKRSISAIYWQSSRL